MGKQFIFCLLILSTAAYAQQSGKTLKFGDFGWTITIPPDYAPMPDEVTPEAEILLRYQKDPAHYIEAYSEAFDENIDGSYAEAMLDAKKNAVEMANQMMPDSTTLTQSETTIGGLVFLIFTTKLVADANFTLFTTTYTHLFKKKTLTITIYYADADEGKRLMAAVQQSTFKN